MTQLSIPAQPAGIYFGVLPNIAGHWLAAQKNLTVMMKDGYTFFKANREIFVNRFRNPDQTTNILINHPDTPFIDAITDKDYHKTVESQRNDFMQTVLLLNELFFIASGQAGFRPENQFLGYNDVATENIFLGDYEATIKYYPTQSYRGSLVGAQIDASQSPEACELFNRAAATCSALINGQEIKVGEEIRQRPPALSLREYTVPAEFKATDFRC